MASLQVVRHHIPANDTDRPIRGSLNRTKNKKNVDEYAIGTHKISRGMLFLPRGRPDRSAMLVLRNTGPTLGCVACQVTVCAMQPNIYETGVEQPNNNVKMTRPAKLSRCSAGLNLVRAVN